MILIIIRAFNSVNIGFSVNWKARAIRQPAEGPDWQIAGWGGQQTAVWRYGIPVSRMDLKNQNDHSGWLLKPLAV